MFMITYFISSLILGWKYKYVEWKQKDKHKKSTGNQQTDGTLCRVTFIL